MSVAPDCVAEIRPIGLEELNSVGALQSRVDTKYLTEAPIAARLPQLLPPHSRVLRIENLQQFAYQSVYFDTPDLLAYRMSASGRRRRFKVRTRAYVDSESAFLEVKTRGARGTTQKVRIPHRLEQLEELDELARLYIASVLEKARIDPGIAYSLTPYLATGYNRTTYFTEPERTPSRITRTTVDTGLYWERLRGERAELFLPSLAIVETKSSAVSNPVNQALWRSGLRPQPISKYCTGAAALDQKLPANKWQRALTQLTQRMPNDSKN